MDEDSFGTVSAIEILQALDQIGELDDIKPQLSKDYEGVLGRLEKIPVRVMYALLDIRYTPPEDFLACATYVRQVVDEIIGKTPEQDIPILQKIESRLCRSLKRDKISLKTLHLSFKYLEIFCKKFPPRKMPNSTHPEDDEMMYQDPYNTVDAENAVLLWNDSRQVSSDEIKVLFLIRESIIYYVQALSTITLHSPLDAETREKCMQNEEQKIECIKKIKKELTKILSWGKSRTPYMSLCEKWWPFEGHTEDYNLRDALRELNQIFQQFSV